MRLIVCVKQVLDPRGIRIDRKAEKVFVNREEYILDPASKAALRAAASVKEIVAASAPPEIVAISLGPDRVDDALREAIALGADRAIHLRDAAFDNADALVAANALAAAIRKVGAFDLVLLGARSIDTGSGELAPRLAEALDLPPLTHVASLQVSGDIVAVVRQFGDSFVRTEANLPAVVSVLPEAFEPGYPDGRRLMDAYKKWSVEMWSAADLSLNEDNLRPMAMKQEDAFPPERQFGTKVNDVTALIAQLKRERVL